MPKIQKHGEKQYLQNPYFDLNPKDLKQLLKQRKLIFTGSKDKCICRLVVDDLSHQINRIFGHTLLLGYTFGSRLYGNAKKNSDFDYLILMNSSLLDQTFDEEMLKNENAEIKSMDCFFNVGWFPDLPEVRQTFKDSRFMFIEEGYYQAWVISEDKFKSMVSHCVPLAVECLSLELMYSQHRNPHNSYATNEEGLKGNPFLFRHRELVKPGCELTTEFPKYSLSQIYTNFGLPAKQMWELVKNQLDSLAADPIYSDENSEMTIAPIKYHRIEKHMYNCFRILLFGIQVAKSGHITKFRVSNSYRDEIVDPIPDRVNPRDHLLLMEKMKRFRHPLLNLFRDLFAICRPPQELELSILKEHRVKMLEYNCISEQAFQNLKSPEITERWLLMVDDVSTLYNLSLVCKQFYKILHSKEFVRELCFLHFGRSFCIKYFQVQKAAKDVESEILVNLEFDWFSCFREKSWANQFPFSKYRCPYCYQPHKEDSYTESSDPSSDMIFAIKQAYQTSWSSKFKSHRGKILLWTCRNAMWEDSYDGVYGDYHLWGKILSDGFEKMWFSLPPAQEKSPSCPLCASTRSKNATEKITGLTLKNVYIGLCSNGHFFGKPDAWHYRSYG